MVMSPYLLELGKVIDTMRLDHYISSLEELKGEALLEELMTQKYISLLNLPEVYRSVRCIGYPVIPKNPYGAEDEIP